MIKIERAQIQDAKDYATIVNQSWKDTYGKYISISHIDEEFNITNLVNNFSEFLKSSNELYMIKLDNKNIGIIEIGKPEDLYKNKLNDYGEIMSFHIKKEFCGKGYGSFAIRFAEKRLKQQGYKNLCVWVKKQNINAINFYKSKGFVETKYSCEETVDGAPSFVMEKYEI